MATAHTRRRTTTTTATTAATTKTTTTAAPVTAAQNAWLPLEGATVYPRNGGVNVRKDASTASPVLYVSPAGEKIGSFTGTTQKMPDGTWFKLVIPGGYGWVRSDVVIVVNKAVSNPTPAQIDGIVQQLQKSDEQVFETLLRCLPKLTSAKSSGANTTAHETKYKQLHTRLSARQSALKNSTALKCQTGVKSTYASLRDKLKSWFGISGASIGEPVSICTVIVISVIVGAAATAAVYFIFKPKYDESAQDLKISSDLEKALSTLTPEKQEEVKADLEKQIDDAYNSGKTDGTFDLMGKAGLYIGLGILGFIAISSLQNSNKKK